MCVKDSNKYGCMIENLSWRKLSWALATPIQLVCFAKALYTYIIYDICTPYLNFVHVYSPRNVIGVCNRSYQNCFLRWCPNTSIVHIEILFSLLFLILLPSDGYHPHMFLASTLWFEIQLWYYQHIAIFRTSLVLQKEENIRMISNMADTLLSCSVIDWKRRKAQWHTKVCIGTLNGEWQTPAFTPWITLVESNNKARIAITLHVYKNSNSSHDISIPCVMFWKTNLCTDTKFTTYFEMICLLTVLLT